MGVRGERLQELEGEVAVGGVLERMRGWWGGEARGHLGPGKMQQEVKVVECLD